VATPPGAGALGVVRISGDRAVDLCSSFLRLRSGPLATTPARALRRATIVDPASEGAVDEVLCALMRAPRSYTGEDLVEISCHGSPVILRRVVSVAVAAGARLAEPGEFTRRAFLNGRIDLAQAEAVAQLISARTERAAEHAVRAVSGGLSAPLRKIRERVLDLIAGLEVTIDFPDEGISLSAGDAAKEADQLAADARRLLQAARQGRLIHEGLVIAIVGAPNAGKSSLLNALLATDRAIVSPIAGTTRDLVEGALVLSGVPIRLIDTAGLAVTDDPIEAEGMRRTRRAMAESDLVIVVVDGSVPCASGSPGLLHGLREQALECATGSPSVPGAAGDPVVTVMPGGGAETPSTSVQSATGGSNTTGDGGRADVASDAEQLVVINKADLPSAACLTAEGVRISALTGHGMDQLINVLQAWIERRLVGDGDEGGIVATLRQIALLEALESALAEGACALSRGVPIEAALVDFRQALALAGAIVGIGIEEAVLDRIFATFCVGK
jgi:tRNA modification GTPase